MSTTHRVTVSFIYSFVRSFMHSFLPSFLPSFVRSFVRFFVSSFFHFFVHSFIRSFVHSFIRSFVHSFIHSFIHSCVHACMHCNFPSLQASSHVSQLTNHSYTLAPSFSHFLFSRKLAVASWVTFASARGGAGLSPTQWFFTWNPPSPPSSRGILKQSRKQMVTGSNPARAVHLLFFFPVHLMSAKHIPQPYIHSCIYIYV